MAVFIALMLVGLSKCLKQIIQIKLNRVKNPNWPEANELAIYKHGRGFEQIQLAVRAGLKLGASELQVQRSYHLLIYYEDSEWSLSGHLWELKNKGKVQLGNPKSGRGGLRDWPLKRAFHYKV